MRVDKLCVKPRDFKTNNSNFNTFLLDSKWLQIDSYYV